MLTDTALRRCDRYLAGGERRCPHRPNALAGHGKHGSVRRTSALRANPDANVSEWQAVASRIASMADSEIRGRYHELVDKGLDSALTALERIELECIETRLDAKDRDPKVEAQDRKWEMERAELLESIENLLRRLRR